MGATVEAVRNDHDGPALPPRLWCLWVRQVDAVVAGMGEGEDGWRHGLDALRGSSAALDARKVATVAGKAEGDADRAHIRHALRVGARMDARRAMGAAD